jgi:hypothetical protein
MPLTVAHRHRCSLRRQISHDLVRWYELRPEGPSVVDTEFSNFPAESFISFEFVVRDAAGE